MKKFTVFYSDETSFSGDPFNSDWKKIPDDKEIVKFVYQLGNHEITMEGYKQYNHLLQCVALGKTGIEKIFLMGREESGTFIFTFDLTKKRTQYRFSDIGDEYNKQILGGWKKGLLTQNPKTSLRKL